MPHACIFQIALVLLFSIQTLVWASNTEDIGRKGNIIGCCRFFHSYDLNKSGFPPALSEKSQTFRQSEHFTCMYYELHLCTYSYPDSGLRKGNSDLKQFKLTKVNLFFLHEGFNIIWSRQSKPTFGMPDTIKKEGIIIHIIISLNAFINLYYSIPSKKFSDFYFVKNERYLSLHQRVF